MSYTSSQQFDHQNLQFHQNGFSHQQNLIPPYPVHMNSHPQLDHINHNYYPNFPQQNYYSQQLNYQNPQYNNQLQNMPQIHSQQQYQYNQIQMPVNDIQCERKVSNNPLFVQDYQGGYKQNIQTQNQYQDELQQQEYNPSTQGINQNQINGKMKEEKNLQVINSKRKEHELKDMVFDPYKKTSKQNKFQENNDMDFITYLIQDIQMYFPNKPIQVFLREYCSKSKISMDITCDDNSKGLGFTSEVIIDGVNYPKGIGKSKKDAKDQAAINALSDICEKDVEIKNCILSIIDKEKKIHLKFKTQKEKSSSSDSQNQNKNPKDNIVTLQDYNPTKNYRDELTQLAQQVLRLTVSYDEKGEANNWETICYLGALSQIGKGQTKKDAKNLAAFKMICLVEQSDEKTIQKLAKKAFTKQKKEITIEKLKELEQYQQKEADEKQKEIQIDLNKQIQEYIEKGQQQQNQKEQINTYSCLIDANYECKRQLTVIKQKSSITAIGSSLVSFQKKYTVPDKDYENLRVKFEILNNSKESFDILGLVDFTIVGSFEFKFMRTYKQTMDVILNYNLEKSAQEKDSIPQQALQIIKGIFKNETPTLQEKNQRKYIQINFNDNLGMIIYFSDVSLGAFCNEVHHALWLSEMKSKLANKELTNLLTFIRHWRESFLIEINTSILDFIAYAITQKFTMISAARNLVSFFEFVAADGLKDVVNQNKRNVDVSQMHFDMINKISEKAYQNFKQECQKIYDNSDYSFMKSLSM